MDSQPDAWTPFEQRMSVAETVPFPTKLCWPSSNEVERYAKMWQPYGIGQSRQEGYTD